MSKTRAGRYGYLSSTGEIYEKNIFMKEKHGYNFFLL
jgi:hypothetical protein